MGPLISQKKLGRTMLPRKSSYLLSSKWWLYSLLLLIVMLISTRQVVSDNDNSYQLLDFMQLRSLGKFSVLIPDSTMRTSSGGMQFQRFLLGVSDEAGSSIIRFNTLNYTQNADTVDSWDQRLFLGPEEQVVESMVVVPQSSSSSAQSGGKLLVVTREIKEVTENHESNGSQDGKTVIVSYTVKRRIIKIEMSESTMRRVSHYDFELQEKRRPVFDGIRILVTESQRPSPIVSIFYFLNSGYMFQFNVETMVPYNTPTLVLNFVSRRDVSYLIEDTPGPYFYVTFLTRDDVIQINIVSKVQPFIATQFEAAYDSNTLSPVGMIYSEGASSLVLLTTSERSYSTVYQYAVSGDQLQSANSWKFSRGLFTHMGLSADQTQVKLAYHSSVSWTAGLYNLLDHSVNVSSLLSSQVYTVKSSQRRLHPLGTNDYFLAMGYSRSGFNLIEDIQPTLHDYQTNTVVRKFSTLMDRVTCSFLYNSLGQKGASIIAGMSYRHFASDEARIVKFDAEYENKLLSTTAQQEFVPHNGANSIEHCTKSSNNTGYFISQQNLRQINAVIYQILELSLEDFSLVRSHRLPIQSGLLFSFISKKNWTFITITFGNLISIYDLKSGVMVSQSPIDTTQSLTKFLAFDNKDETVALISTGSNEILAVDIETGSILHMHVIGHPFNCALKVKSKLIVPLFSATEDCSLVEIVSKSAKMINFTEASYPRGTLCDIASCFLDDEGHYAFFSSQSHGNLFQVEVRKETKYVSYYPVGTVITSAVFDPSKEQGYYFDTPSNEGSLLFLMQIPRLDQPAQRNHRLYIGLSVATVIILFILCICVILLLLKRTTSQNKKHSAGTMNKTLLDNDHAQILNIRNYAWSIDMADLRIDKLLHEGPLGKTFFGFYKNERVAIKQLRGTMNDSEEQLFNTKVDVIFNLHHASVIPFYGVCHSTDFTFLISQFAEKRSIESYLRGEFVVGLQDKLKMLCQVCQAMIYLHSLNVTHGNLKPQNILLDRQMRVKVSGFLEVLGSGNYMNGSMSFIQYLAPEVIKNQMYSPSSDVYSFAMVMYYVLFECPPYQMPQEQYNLYMIGAEIIQGRRPHVPFIQRVRSPGRGSSAPLFNSSKLEKWSTQHRYPAILVDKYLHLMVSCWQDTDVHRPDFETCHRHLSQIYDHLMDTELI